MENKPTQAFAVALQEASVLLDDIVITKETLESPEFAETYSKMSDLMALLKLINDKVTSDSKQVVKDNFMETGESSMKVGDYTFTYCSEYTRENFDKKKFIDANGEDAYNKYIKLTKVKESIKISKDKPKADPNLIEVKEG